MTLIKSFLLFISLAFFCIKAISQTTTQPETDAAEAKDDFVYGDWIGAIKEYEALVKVEPNNPLYNYRLGISYLQTYIDYSKAIKHLDAAIKNGSNEKDAHFMLAKAYHLDEKFDKAIVEYKKADEGSSEADLKARAKLYIQMCETAKKMVKYPVKNIRFVNLGEDINSDAPDFTPYMSENQSELYFTSKRSKNNQGYLAWDGLYTEDIYIVKDKNGEWSKARSLGGAVGTSHDDEVTGLSVDASTIFIDFFDFETEDEVLAAEKKGKQFSKPYHLNENINVSGAKQVSACIDPKTNMLYFASNKEGGKGGYDIYSSKQLPTGEWGIPIAVEELNTKWDDAFPHMLSDGKTMYFASEGHGSMGGYDVFTCIKNEETGKFESIKNVGYPLNTADNNYHIAFDKTGRYGYLSTHIKEDSFGDLDIYEVVFEDVEDRISTFVGSMYENIPIDYKEYEKFIILQKGDLKKRFTYDYLPDTVSEWKVIEQIKKEKRPGFKYNAILTFEKDGELKRFSAKKVPPNINEYVFKDIEIKIMPDKNSKTKPAKGPEFYKSKITDASILVYNKEGNKKLGEFVANSKNQRFVIALPVGEYKIEIESEGYKPYSSTFKVPGKSSFKPLSKKSFELTPNKPKEPVSYRDLENKDKD